jgi:predicted dehydrogenase
VEVNDPDHEPFVAHLPMAWPKDIPLPLREKAQAQSSAQLREAAGCPLDEMGMRALSSGFLSALVHDVAVVHGMLGHLSCELPSQADHGALFDEGRGVQLGFRLPGGGRVCMTHLNLPAVPDYTERITIYCSDQIIELIFPSPYLRHLPTKLTVRRRGDGHALVVCDHRVNFEEAFREQLRAFHSAATSQTLVYTTIEQARRDIKLLTSAFTKAIA